MLKETDEVLRLRKQVTTASSKVKILERLIEDQARDLYLSEVENKRQNLFREILKAVAISANSSHRIEEALQTCMDQICTLGNWPIGHLYVPANKQEARNSEKTLVSAGIWHLDEPNRFAEFQRVTQETSFSPGKGLPGRVLASSKPVWITDASKDDNFPRYRKSEAIAVKAAFAFPILIGPEVVGVLEFFSPVALEPDSALLEIMGEIGIQLGRVVERERIYEALERLASFPEESPNAILETDLHGRVTYQNPSAKKAFPELLSDPENHPILLGLRSIILGLTQSQAKTVVREIKLGDRFFQQEVAHIPKIQVIRIHHLDITDRKELQARMIQSERMISLGTMAAGMAHEINNPLSFLITNLELIQLDLEEYSLGKQSSTLMEKLKGGIQIAAQGARRIQQIVRNLKTISRFDEEKIESVDIKKVLESSLDIAAAEIKHRARVVKNFKSLDPLLANEGKLSQVFINILVNAGQAIPEGHVDQNEITLTTERLPQNRMSIKIRDTGAGIPKKILNRIFDPFFTTKPVGIGTGLGLSICHSIIASFKGELHVESKEGQGTEFQIILPIASATSGTADPTQSASLPKSSIRGRILILDDEPFIADALFRLLSRQHEVVLAENGRAALNLLKKDPSFDVILSDLMMPDLTGMDIFALIQKEHPGLEKQILFLTGGAFTEQSKTFLAQIPNLRLEKPFESRTLMETVNNLVITHRASKA